MSPTTCWPPSPMWRWHRPLSFCLFLAFVLVCSFDSTLGRPYFLLVQVVYSRGCLGCFFFFFPLFLLGDLWLRGCCLGLGGLRSQYCDRKPPNPKQQP